MPDLDNYATFVIKKILTTKIWGCDTNNGDLVLKGTNAGDEANAIIYTLSKKTDGTASFTCSIPMNNIKDYTILTKATIGELQGGTNKSYNAKIEEFEIDSNAITHPTTHIMAGDLVQLFNNNSVNPTIETYNQPNTQMMNITNFQTPAEGWTPITGGTNIIYTFFAPLTIVRQLGGAFPNITFWGILTAPSGSNSTLYPLIIGQIVTWTVELEVLSLFSDNYVSMSVNNGWLNVGNNHTYHKTSRITKTITAQMGLSPLNIGFLIGIVGSASTGSVVNVYSWKLELEHTKKTVLGVAQENGNRGETIKVCTKGITTAWAYSGAGTSSITKGVSLKPVENDTIATGSGAIDLTKMSKAPNFGISYDNIGITANASRSQCILCEL